jgi:DNA-directed RNA polymerase specialized sigma24 family protein
MQRADALHIVAGLAPRERDVLLRFHVDGESVAEIAAALCVPIGTVKSDLARARKRLAGWHGPREQRNGRSEVTR